MLSTVNTDILIVGAGPIGLELAVALKQAGVDYVHVDARQIGYTISWFAPGTRFFSSPDRIAIAGVPLQTVDQNKATREEYLAYLRMIVQLYDLPIRTYESVGQIERRDGVFHVTTSSAGATNTIVARHVVLCTGGTDHPRRLEVPGEDLPHVSHYFQDPHLYFRKKLLIVGGKNSAVEAALRCHQAGAQVTISYRRECFNANSIKYWLLPEINGLAESGKIQARFNTRLTRIEPGCVGLQRTDGSALPDEPTDFVLALIGYEADVSLLKNAGVELRGPGNRPVFDEKTMETNVPGIFVAGTATGGTQEKYTVFIENCHVHVKRIVGAITGRRSDAPAPVYARPES